MDRSRQDFLFSLIFRGSGEEGKWTAADWALYRQNRDKYWQNPSTWINPDPDTWDSFALHVERLASHYDETQKEEFVRDFSLLFGGISSHDDWYHSMWDNLRGPEVQPLLNEGNLGLQPQYIDNNVEESQAHHYAGIFFAGYYLETAFAIAGNTIVRDPDNPGDIGLGNQAAVDAYQFRFYSRDMGVLAEMIMRLSQPWRMRRP